MASYTIILVVAVCFSLVLISRSVAETGEKQRIVIDTDAGVDDAIAILAVLGDPYYSKLVQGITCVRGNTEVDKVSVNVLKTLTIASRIEIPVYVGASKGYMESPNIGHYFGKDGMGDANYPESPPLSILQKNHAAEFLAKVVSDYPGEVTLLCLGPMTNVALATRLNPKFMSQIKNIVGLVGSIKGVGNMKPNVEFNAYMDPHAASIVMQELSDAGRKMTLIPTNAIRENSIDKQWRIKKLGAINSRKVNFMNKIEKRQLEDDGDVWDTFDVFISVVMMRPDAILENGSYYGDFETQGQITKGSLVVDYSNILNKTPNAEVVFKIDKKVVKTVCLNNLS